jgi:hypothetical protein
LAKLAKIKNQTTTLYGKLLHISDDLDRVEKSLFTLVKNSFFDTKSLLKLKPGLPLQLGHDILFRKLENNYL